MSLSSPDPDLKTTPRTSPALERARRLGFPVVTDLEPELDPVAARLLPAEVDAVAVSRHDGTLEVLVDEVPTAATIESYERLTGHQVSVAVTHTATLERLRLRASRPDGVPDLTSILAQLPADATRAVLRVGQSPIVQTPQGVAPDAAWGPLSADTIEDLAEFLCGDSDRKVVAWAGRRWAVRRTLAAGTTVLTLAATTDTRSTLSDLGLPATLSTAADRTHGLIVVASPSGHGKSATLAALTARAAASRPGWVRVITDIPDATVISRRADLSLTVVGIDMPTAAAAVDSAVADGATVIAVDVPLTSSADVEAVSRAALAGPLVLVAVPAPTVAHALVALTAPLDSPARPGAFAALGAAYQAGFAQRLYPGSAGGLTPAVEQWWRTPALADALGRGELHQLEVASYDVPEAATKNVSLETATQALAAGNRIPLP